jgi:hypothetical protein
LTLAITVGWPPFADTRRMPRLNISGLIHLPHPAFADRRRDS